VRPGQRDNLARQGPEPTAPSARIGRNPGQPNQAFQLAGSGNRAGRALRNPAFADRPNPAGRALARATFQGSFAARHGGRFADRRDGRRHHRYLPALVIGWAGPLFWPYAYDDFVSYTFYPYAYDTFWPNAYDDVYASMFGPYAPGPGPTYAAVGRSPSSGGARPGAARTVGADLCSGQTAGLTDWPIERIAQTVQPDEAQRTALDQLRDATAKALDILKASCPTELPSTPTGRIAAMQARLDAMLQAVRTLRPALETFYQSLNDEQKARFNALGPEDDRDQQQARRDLSQACGERAAGIVSLPIERIERSVRPDEGQRSALKELEDAIAQAVSLLRSECPTYRPLTAVGRLEAMEQRLDAMLRAVQTVQPALEKFYSSLSDEQKERFNRLNPAQG
jgi:ABC-type transporter MlaC component